MNKSTQTSRATSNTSNSDFNSNLLQWSKASSSDEEDIGMRKCRRKSKYEITNEESKGKISEVEEIKNN